MAWQATATKLAEIDRHCLEGSIGDDLTDTRYKLISCHEQESWFHDLIAFQSCIFTPSARLK